MKKLIIHLLIVLSLLVPQISFAQQNVMDIAQDAMTKSRLSGLRANAEIFYDDAFYKTSQKEGSYKNLCKDKTIKDVLSKIKNDSGKKPKCTANKDSYAISAPLKSDSSIKFCIDSTGFAGEGSISSKNKKNKCNQAISKDNQNGDVDKDDHFISGNINSEVKFVTYSSLEDPFSRRFDKTIRSLSDIYLDRVAFVFRHNPLSLIFKNSVTAANAAECVSGIGNEKKFSEYVYSIYRAQDVNSNFILNEDSLSLIAGDLGLNKDDFDSCLKNKKYSKKIDSDLKKIEGTEMSQGVPYSVVYGPNNKKQLIAGAQAYDQVKQIIDSFLNI